MSSLKKLAIRGIIWTVVSYGTSQILRFGSNLILTRLLFPKLFGLMALLNIFIIGLHLFSDIGIGPSIIQNKRGDEPAFLNTAWTLQIVRGCGLWLCCVAIAWPLAKFYQEPQFLWLIPVVGLSTIISGFNSTALFTLNRQMAVGKLGIFELGVQVISLTVMIVWAWFSPTIWALIIAGLVADLVRLVWSHRLIPGSRNRFAWDREAADAIFSFGRWVFVSTALTFLATQADRLILGKLFSFEMLGVYGIAYMLAEMPRQLTLVISGKVIFPTVARLTHLPRETLRAKILQKRRLVLGVLALGLTVLLSFGDILILSLYDQRYVQAAWMLPILALGIWPNVLFQTLGGPFLLAVGKPIYAAYGNFLRLLIISIGLPLGFSLKGIVGVVIVVAFAELPLYGALTYGLWREEMTAVAQDIMATALFLVLLTAVLMGRFVLGFGLPISGIL